MSAETSAGVLDPVCGMTIDPAERRRELGVQG